MTKCGEKYQIIFRCNSSGRQCVHQQEITDTTVPPTGLVCVKCQHKLLAVKATERSRVVHEKNNEEINSSTWGRT